MDMASINFWFWIQVNFLVKESEAAERRLISE